MNTNKKTQWILPISLLLMGLFVGYFSSTMLSNQHEAELTSLRALNLTKDQELKATKIALDVAKSKVEVWREQLVEAANGEVGLVSP